MSIFSEYIHDDLRDISGDALIRNNFVDIIKKLLHLISSMHNLNIVHLDIKPANILVDDYMNFYMIDFGLSRINNHNFYCQHNCKQKLYTQPYRSFNNVRFLQKYKCNKNCNHYINLRKEDLFAMGPLLYEIWHGTDSFFIDIKNNNNEMKNHFNYFKSKKFNEKYNKFISKTIPFLIKTNQIKKDEIDKFKRLMKILVCDIPGNNTAYDQEILNDYGYILNENAIEFTSNELELIDLLKYDDYTDKKFNTFFKSKKQYIHKLLNCFMNFIPDITS
jgi:serine/threonine protein kinase